jgi:hypothetical protein
MHQADAFNPEALRLLDADALDTRKVAPKRPPHHRPGEAFIKGPIPWAWLKTAALLPGKALPVALLLWKQAGCQHSRTVRFCLSHAEELGIAPGAARRALRGLAHVGLVCIERHAGQCSEVTLLEMSA